MIYKGNLPESCYVFWQPLYRDRPVDVDEVQGTSRLQTSATRISATMKLDGNVRMPPRDADLRQDLLDFDPKGGDEAMLHICASACPSRLQSACTRIQSSASLHLEA